MAGGKYDKLAGKTRPGTYINFESDRNDTVGNSERGIVLLPLIGYDFGPAKTPITLTAAAPDAYSVELGRSVYDATNDKMRLIREAFKKAAKVIVYITESGTAATGAAAPLTVTAKYGGTRGNDIHISVVANPVGGFDVTVYLDTPTSKSSSRSGSMLVRTHSRATGTTSYPRHLSAKAQPESCTPAAISCRAAGLASTCIRSPASRLRPGSTQRPSSSNRAKRPLTCLHRSGAARRTRSTPAQAWLRVAERPQT